MIDYAVIAKILREIMNGSSLKVALVNTLARYFEDVDPEFNKKSFKKSCNSSNEYIPIITETKKMDIYRTTDALKGLQKATEKMSSIVKKTLGYGDRKIQRKNSK